MYAVSGITGVVGRQVADQLIAAGHEVRGIVRNLRRAEDIPGVELVEADYGHASSVRRALEGVDGALMVSIVDGVERTADVQAEFVAGAAQADLKHLVYLSFIGADASSPYAWARDHGETEDLMRGLGVPATILRPSFRDDMIRYIAADGAFRGPAGDGRLALVSTRDVVEACAAALVDFPVDDSTYRLTGPEALTLGDIAEILGIEYLPETSDETRARLAAESAPAELVEAWVSSAEAIRDGVFAEVTGDVETLTGRRPSAAADFLRS